MSDYQRGVIDGATAEQKRHARLVHAARETLDWCRKHATDFRTTDICQDLTAGLAELED